MTTRAGDEPAAPGPHPVLAPRWRSAELLRGATEVLIEHEQQVYRLRLTNLGKLILTK